MRDLGEAAMCRNFSVLQNLDMSKCGVATLLWQVRCDSLCRQMSLCRWDWRAGGCSLEGLGLQNCLAGPRDAFALTKPPASLVEKSRAECVLKA